MGKDSFGLTHTSRILGTLAKLSDNKSSRTFAFQQATFQLQPRSTRSMQRLVIRTILVGALLCTGLLQNVFFPTAQAETRPSAASPFKTGVFEEPWDGKFRWIKAQEFIKGTLRGRTDAEGRLVLNISIDDRRPGFCVGELVESELSASGYLMKLTPSNDPNCAHKGFRQAYLLVMDNSTVQLRLYGEKEELVWGILSASGVQFNVDSAKIEAAKNAHLAAKNTITQDKRQADKKKVQEAPDVLAGLYVVDPSGAVRQIKGSNDNLSFYNVVLSEYLQRLGERVEGQRGEGTYSRSYQTVSVATDLLVYPENESLYAFCGRSVPGFTVAYKVTPINDSHGKPVSGLWNMSLNDKVCRQAKVNVAICEIRGCAEYERDDEASWLVDSRDKAMQLSAKLKQTYSGPTYDEMVEENRRAQLEHQQRASEDYVAPGYYDPGSCGAYTSCFEQDYYDDLARQW
jgi:hypothetical protein